MDSSALWKRTLGATGGAESNDRERLRDALRKFRSRVSQLVATIGQELAGLTVHDITHLDALWHVADEVLGDDYVLTPAEAFVLGGAILLHDAAHATAAYAGGVEEIKAGSEWRDFVALRLGGTEPSKGSDAERMALFHILRELHAKQAEKLPWVAWKDPAGDSAYLIEDAELRAYFGGAIGLVAASHHWDVGVVPERLKPLMLTPAGFLKSSKWGVDVLKLAMIMRVIDAAHIDSLRAPWFLFALKKPSGISMNHWRFQGKIGRVTRVNSELVIAGSAFDSTEEAAWWLAFDAATLIDREIKDSQRILGEHSKEPFPVNGVLGAHSAAAFSKYLPVKGWFPVDVYPKIGDVPHLIERLGGSALYGDNPSVAIRELIQNAIDSCAAYEALVKKGGRRVEVKLLKNAGDQWVISVSDNGIGMSRYVLTNVLMDFGKSLWSSSDVMNEFPGLISSGFSSGGKFGIGFFSVFMLGAKIRVKTRRFEKVDADASDQWVLSFNDGLQSRPSLQVPEKECRLPESGTEVAVSLSADMLLRVLEVSKELYSNVSESSLVCSLIRRLAPASPYDIDFVGEGGEAKAVVGGDWKSIDDNSLLSRFSQNTGPLWGLRNAQGELVGRLSPDERYGSDARGVVRGVVASKYTGLKGLVYVAGNNSDARRHDACPHGDLADWQRWVREIVSDSPELTISEWLSLNPLLPEEDMKVWGMGGEAINLGELKKRLISMNRIVVHFGEIEHDDSDEMSMWRFEREFKQKESVVITPGIFHQDGYRMIVSPGDVDKEFPWILGVKRIDYLARLRDAIKEVWGACEEDDVEDWVEVGYVGSDEITRTATVYRRLLK